MSGKRLQTQNQAVLAAQVAALEKVLAAQLQDYRALLACVQQKSEAIRHAQMDRISAIFSRETEIVQRIGDSERIRSDIIQKITVSIQPAAEKSLRVSEIAEAHPDEAVRKRLLAVAEQLRSVVTEVKERSSRVRSAAEALGRHMSGVVQSVRSALSRAGVYEPKGRLAVGAQLDFSVDIQS